MMSTKMRSGWWSAILASASKPFSARITWQPACMRNISALRRIVLLSSMTITRTPVRFLESATLPLEWFDAARCQDGPLYPAKTIVNRQILKRFRMPAAVNSKLHHFEIFLAGAALRAAPSRRDVLPARAGRNAVLGPAFGLVVDETASQAAP